MTTLPTKKHIRQVYDAFNEQMNKMGPLLGGKDDFEFVPTQMLADGMAAISVDMSAEDKKIMAEKYMTFSHDDLVRLWMITYVTVYRMEGNANGKPPKARDMIEAPTYQGQPVRCPECSKPYSENTIHRHRATVHKIGGINRAEI